MSHSRQTEHYGLPLYDGTDIINPLTDFNNANEAIDEALYNANQRSVEAENTAGDAKEIAEGYDARVSQAVQTANDAMTLANNTQDMIAEDFDPMKQGGYQVGDFVIYNGVLYRFINAHTGAWDASDVQVSPVLIEALEDVVEEGKQAINEAVEEAEEEIAGQTEKVTKTQAMIAQPFDENKVGGYAVDDVVTYADKLYKFTSAHSGAWTGLDVEQVDVVGLIPSMRTILANPATGHNSLKVLFKDIADAVALDSSNISPNAVLIIHQNSQDTMFHIGANYLSSTGELIFSSASRIFGESPVPNALYVDVIYLSSTLNDNKFSRAQIEASYVGFNENRIDETLDASLNDYVALYY